MMVNKVAVAANVVSNQAGTPSTTSVDVERVVSKITYMPTQDNNLYKVEDETAKYTVTTTSGWRVEDNIATYMTGMACGTLNGKIFMNIRVFIMKRMVHIVVQQSIKVKHYIKNDRGRSGANQMENNTDNRF